MQEEVVSETLRLLRAEPAKTTPCLHSLRSDGLVPKLGPLSDSEKAFLETYVKAPQIPKEYLKACQFS